MSSYTTKWSKQDVSGGTAMPSVRYPTQAEGRAILDQIESLVPPCRVVPLQLSSLKPVVALYLAAINIKQFAIEVRASETDRDSKHIQHLRRTRDHKRGVEWATGSWRR